MDDEFQPEARVRERVGWTETKLTDLMQELATRRQVTRMALDRKDRHLLILSGIIRDLLGAKLVTQSQAYTILYSATQDERFPFCSIAGYVLGHLVADLTPDSPRIAWEEGRKLIRARKDFFLADFLDEEIFLYTRFWKAKNFALQQ